jgi:hypothetical protein
MTPLEIVLDAVQKKHTMDDGDPVTIELSPPLTGTEIAELESRLPCPLPADVRALLAHCGGFSGGAVDFVDFTGRDCEFGGDDLFPHGLPIAADGYGNFWVVDLLPTSTGWGPIYFACHDAPVLLYQSPTLEHFLTELFKMTLPPHESLVDDVHEDRLFEVWRKNPGVVSHAAAVTSSDPEIRAFAEQLGPTFQIIDLRHAAIGFGFSWGRYGAGTVVRRRGRLPIFAYQERKGFFQRLFSR